MSDSNSKVRRFAGNSGWMMVQKIYSMLISLVVGSLSARYLGPSNYGVLSYGTSIISFFLTISALGFDSILVAEMIKDPEKEGHYLGSALLMRLLTSVASFGLIWCVVLVLEPNNILIRTVTMLQALSIIFESYQVFQYWFQLKLQMKYVTLASMAGLTITAGWRIALLATNQPVEFFALSNSISALVCGTIVVIFFLKNKTAPRLKLSLEDSKYLLRNSYHFIISALAITLYTQLDKLMLGKMMDTEILGFYSAASTVVVMWEFVPNALINSARPLLLEKMKNDYDGYIRLFKLLMLGMSIMGIVVGIGCLLLGKLAIWVLYGEEYFAALPAMNILVWSTSFATIGTARTIWIVGEGKNKYPKYYVVIGAFVNAVLNFVFIPILGATGAAITTLISQIVVAIIAPLFFKETRVFVPIYFSSFKLIPELWNVAKMALHKEK